MEKPQPLNPSPWINDPFWQIAIKYFDHWPRWLRKAAKQIQKNEELQLKKYKKEEKKYRKFLEKSQRP